MALTVNELLCFVSAQSDKLTRDHLQTTVHDFFTLDEARAAKSILLSEYEKALDADLIKEARKQRQIAKSGAKLKIVNDILDIWQVIDTRLAGKLSTLFVAADINRLPSVNADKFSLQFLIFL